MTLTAKVLTVSDGVADGSREDKSGELVEAGPARQIFTSPKDPRTEAYITGRIG